MLETCNPCVSGDTLILTDKGYFPIRDLVGHPVNVWNGEEFSQVVPRITGKEQPMLKITFSNGHVLRCTYNHTFYLKDGKKIKAINLQVGDKLQKWNLPVIEGTMSVRRIGALTVRVLRIGIDKPQRTRIGRR
jgi:ribonucleoside-diphosphate reductase alpha chain